ncbi:MAG: ATP synthase F1 subunit epsilon [Lachnospiraceae bacterium]|nr:ATP synthase F1 subunit epsilon [Lachnospiraceae bacterium]
MREFDLHIIEADDDFYNGKCVSLVIPTTEGMYGIQAMHENLVAAIEIGVLKFTLPDGTRRHAAVSNGIVKVENNEVLILVESIEDPDDIDEARAREEEEMAKDVLGAKNDRFNYRAAKGMLARAVNRLKIKKRYGKYN